MTAAVWWQPERTRTAAATPPASGVAFAALVSFTAILILSPQAWFPVLGTLRIAFVVAAVAIGTHLLSQLVRPQQAPALPAEILIAFTLVAWAVLTVPVSLWPGGSVLVLTDRYLKAVAFFWLIGTLATTVDRLRMLAWTFVVGSIPLAATGIYNYVAGDVLSTGVEGFTRIAGYTGGSNLAANPNDLALMLNLTLPLAAALIWMSRSRWAKCLAAVALLLAVTAVILTFSRAGFLTLAASLLMGLGLLIRRGAAGSAAALIAVALLALPLLPSGYVDRLRTISDIQADATGSAQGRWRDTKVAAGLVIERPIIGAGIGQDMLAMNEERGIDTWRRVHNVYLQYGVDLGLPGMLLFIWLHVACVRSARIAGQRASRNAAFHSLTPLAAGVRVSLVAFAVAAMFHPIAYHFYFFSVAGLAVALRAATAGAGSAA